MSAVPFLSRIAPICLVNSMSTTTSFACDSTANRMSLQQFVSWHAQRLSPPLIRGFIDIDERELLMILQRVHTTVLPKPDRPIRRRRFSSRNPGEIRVGDMQEDFHPDAYNKTPDHVSDKG